MLRFSQALPKRKWPLIEIVPGRIPRLDEALRIQPADPFARWLSGACFEREGALTDAEAAYRQAIAVTEFPDPKLLVAWGRALEKSGRLDESQEAYRRAALLR